jgi:iron(III) transport system substrate-binding protein
MPKARTLLVLLATAVLACLPLMARAQSGEVNLYTARHYDTDDRIYSEFTALTGIRVNVVEGTDDQIIERLKAEGPNSPADVLITVDAGRLWRAEQAGVLQPIRSAILEDRVPASLRHPEGQWFGLAKRARVLVYSAERVAPSELSTYEDLATERWAGRVVARSSTHVYNQSLVGSMIESNGLDATERWARGLVANFARPPRGGDTPQIMAVASGQADVAIVNHYYFARLLNSEKADERDAAAKLALFFPNQGATDRGTHVNISGAGVTAHAPHRDNAIAFLEYLTSPSAQHYFAVGSMEFPVIDGVELHPTLAGFGPFKSDEANAARFGANNPLALMLMDRAGWK